MRRTSANGVLKYAHMHLPVYMCMRHVHEQSVVLASVSCINEPDMLATAILLRY